MVLGITAALVLVGLQIVAMAQAYQCLMQIEINTRYAAPAVPPVPDVAHTTASAQGLTVCLSNLHGQPSRRRIC